MIELLTSILGGGVTGVLGSAVQRIFEYKTAKLQIEANKDKYAHELAIVKAQADAKVSAEDARAFKDALTSEPKRYSEGAVYNSAQTWLLVILDFMRGSIRPILTTYLCVLTTLIYLQVRKLLGMDVPIDSAVDLLKLIISTVLYLTTTCVSFWFGTRNPKKPV